MVAVLLEWLSFSALLGDKAYDAHSLRNDVKQSGVDAVIPPRNKRPNPANYDAEKSNLGQLIENLFQKLKNSEVSPCVPAKLTQTSQP